MGSRVRGRGLEQLMCDSVHRMPNSGSTRYASVTSLIAALYYDFERTRLLCGPGQDVQYTEALLRNEGDPGEQDGVGLIIY